MSISPSSFAICTLFNDSGLYADMRRSFEAAGFAQSSVLAFDNTRGNRFDPYRVITQALADPPAPYVIYCHEDVRLDRGDGYARLAEVIAEMDALDPKWAVLGNAGSTDDFEYVIRITDNGKEYNQGSLPARVHSLDENFLVMKPEPGVGCSGELSGFHLYATDLCLNAMKRGSNSYVVDFHVNHLCKGVGRETLDRDRRAFVERWARETPFLFIRTPVLEIFISRYTLLQRILDRPKIRTWLISHNSVIKPFQRWPER